jgi:hypothetical protein
MADYCSEADMEKVLGYAIDASSRPTTTELALMLTISTSYINAELKQSTNLTDTYGILKAVACNVTYRQINNLFALQDPDKYAMLEVGLTPEEIRLLHMAHSVWDSITWDTGE